MKDVNNSKKNDVAKEDKKNEVKKVSEKQKKSIDSVMRIFSTK